jgi:hypothetical protein
MRALAIIIGGLVLAVCSLFAGRYVGNSAPGAIVLAAKGFLVVWFFLALYNLWMGVSRAGYSFAEELPIFLVIYAIPAGVAAYTWWKPTRCVDSGSPPAPTLC